MLFLGCVACLIPFVVTREEVNKGSVCPWTTRIRFGQKCDPMFSVERACASTVIFCSKAVTASFTKSYASARGDANDEKQATTTTTTTTTTRSSNLSSLPFSRLLFLFLGFGLFYQSLLLHLIYFLQTNKQLTMARTGYAKGVNGGHITTQRTPPARKDSKKGVRIPSAHR